MKTTVSNRDFVEAFRAYDRLDNFSFEAYTAGYGDIKGFTATIPYPYNESGHLCHFEAVKALVKKNNLDWNLEGMRYGDSADGRGFSFCFDSSKVTQ